MLLAFLSMAKKRGRGRRRMNLRRVRLTPEVALVTLATDTALVVSLTAGASSSYRAVTVKAAWSITALTEGEGPLTVGLAHGSYSVTEIKESSGLYATHKPA